MEDMAGGCEPRQVVDEAIGIPKGFENVRLRFRGRWLRRFGSRERGMTKLVRCVPGWLSDQEAVALYRLGSTLPGIGHVAEIGSWKGRSTVALSLGLMDAGRTDGCLYAIDPHQGSEEHSEIIASAGTTLGAFRSNLRRYGTPQLVTEMVMPSVQAADVLVGEGVRLGLVFVDGAHDEQSVRDDIRAFLPLLLPGGLVALHDFDPGWPGVIAAYRSELESISEPIDQHDSLLIVRVGQSVPSRPVP
jgi:predicted O-methyltransferase YrrM